MSDTVLEHPLVRWYLSELDRASLCLPTAQARELREQITAHLEEALPPGATMEQVGDELDRLGSARSLVAEAAGPASRPLAARARIRLGHVRWWAWALIAVLVSALGTGAALLIAMNSAPALVASGEIGWLDPADRGIAVETTAGDVTQTAVPFRLGQRQGIVVELVNESDWTQQVVGIGPRWMLGSLPGTAQVSVEGGPGLNQVGATATGARSSDYTVPGFIPPHSTRLVHVSWTSNLCWGGQGEMSIGSITLLVRVGVLTKTEDIRLQQAFALIGPGHAITRGCD